MSKLQRSGNARRTAVAAALLAAVGAGSAAAAVVDFQSTVVVGPTGSPAVNGAALLTALSGISASAGSPVLLKIEPGVYDVGITPMVMKEYVDVEGSGRGVTLIQGAVVDAFSAAQGVVTVVAHSELRGLTVENAASGVGSDSAAIVLRPGARASDVAAVATGAADINRAILATAAYLSGTATPSLLDVTATAATRAVQVVYPGLNAENLTAIGDQALFVSSGPVSLRDSVVRGSDFSVLVANLTLHADFVSTQIDGDVTCPKGAVCRCVGSYDGDLNKLDSDCRPPPGRRPF